MFFVSSENSQIIVVVHLFVINLTGYRGYRIENEFDPLCRTSVFKEYSWPHNMQLKCTNLARVFINTSFQRNKRLHKKWLPGLNINHQNRQVNGHQPVVDQVVTVRLALVMVRVDRIRRDIHRNRILTGTFWNKFDSKFFIFFKVILMMIYSASNNKD